LKKKSATTPTATPPNGHKKDNQTHETMKPINFGSTGAAAKLPNKERFTPGAVGEITAWHKLPTTSP